MDIATILGLVIAAAAMVYAILAGGGVFSAFVDYPSLACVFGGAFAAALLCFPLRNVMALPRVMSKSVFNKVQNIEYILRTLVSLAETARRDGLLALESRLLEIDDRFIRLGTQLVIDGTRPEVIEDILRTEMDAVATRHRDGKGVVDQIGKFCPAFGMIGTLLGLIIMLGQMSDPSKIGGGMAVALITTLYGAVASNAFFLPLAEKLSFFNRNELLAMEIVIKGILAIQSGENPRVIDQKLSMFLPPRQRAAREKQAA